MVKHVILWTLKDEYSAEEKKEIKAGIKSGLEGLQGQIPGMTEIKVFTEPLAKSNVEVMLYSVFEDMDALEGYAASPIHNAVADAKVRPYTATRSCINYED